MSKLPLSADSFYKGKGNPFIEVEKGAKTLLTTFDEMQKKLINVNKELTKSIKSNTKESAADYRKLNTQLTSSQKNTEALNRINKEKERLDIKLNQLNKQSQQRNEELKLLTQQQAKANKQLAKESLGLVGAYDKLNKELGDARKKAKNVAAQYGTTSKQFQKASKNVLTLDSRLKKIDKSLGLNQRSVGNYGLAWKGAAKNLLSFAAASLSLRAAFRVVSSAVKTIAQFEKAQSEVVAITGATTEEIERLEKSALKLGATTSKTAVEVSGLQKEFAKLGFSTSEILAATEATISLSVAAGSDLAESAVVAASTVRGFNLSASETQRVVDVMAESFSSSALDLEKFKTAMATAAPVATSFGKDIEFTTARLSVLSDAGIDASTAGTSLRNIFLELSKRGLTWEQGLDQINESTNKSVTALDLFGKRGATAALVLADNVDKANELEKAYRNADGAAKDMAETMEDNLIGDTTRLSSAWDGFILSLNKGDGQITKTFRGLTQWLTNVVTLFTRMNSGYQDIIDEVAENNLQENLKEDAKELNFLIEKYSEFYDADEARRRAADALIESNEKIKQRRVEQLKFIDDTIAKIEQQLQAEQNLSRAQKTKLENDLRIFKIEKEKEESFIGLMDRRIEALELAKLTTIETSETEEETTETYENQIETLETLNKKLADLEKQKRNIALTDTAGLITKQNEINSVKEQIEVYEALFKLLSETPEDIDLATDFDIGKQEESAKIFAELEKGKTDELKKQLELRKSLTEQQHDSLIGLLFNYAARRKVANQKLSSEEIQAEIDKNERIKNQVQQLADSLISVYNSVLNSRLQQIQSEIDAQNQSINEQEQLLNRELELRQAGAANEYEIEKNKLEKLQAEKKKNLQKQKELQKEQEQINTLTQISALATAVAQIIQSATSELGWLGVVAGLAAAAAAVIGFSTYKGEAESAALAEDGDVFTKKGTHIESGKRHSKGGNKYSSAEFEEGEAVSVFSRNATGKYYDEIRDFTNALNNDQYEMYKAGMARINPSYTFVETNYKELLSEQKKTNAILNRQKYPMSRGEDIYFYDSFGKFIGTNL